MKFKECLEKFNVEKATKLMKHGKTQAYIGEIFGIDAQRVCDCFKYYGIKFIRRTFYVNDEYFDNIDSENGWGEISIKERLILIYHKEDSWILAGAPFSTDIEKINSIKKQGCPADFLRGYPFTFLGTKDEWRRMEKESKSNLVLTEEQVQEVIDYMDEVVNER